MFRTQDADMRGLPGIFGHGLRQWSQVSRVFSHWYHVTIQGKNEGRVSEVVLMIDDEYGLQQALIAQDARTIITDVQVVTPAHMNGTGKWRMEKLTQVILGEDQHECAVCVMEVESGCQYHSSDQPDFTIDQLSMDFPIFNAKMISGV